VSPRKAPDDHTANGAAHQAGGSSRPARPGLDQTDVKILRYLTNDARISQRALAREIGMSPPAVADRIARLEAVGVIRGYRVDIDFDQLGWEMTILVGITAEVSRGQRELAQEVLAIPEVERVDLTTGSADLQVRVRVRDRTHFNEMFFDRLLAIPGIRHTSTALALYTYEPENFTLRVLDSHADEPATADEPGHL